MNENPRRGRGKGLLFIEAALSSATDTCVEWPFSRMKNGYGQVGCHDGMKLAHRLVCEKAHGAPPFERAQAAHSCGNRACVNPRHVRWATQAENEADKLAHGTWFSRMGGAKLDETMVRIIRETAAQGLNHREVAEALNIPRRTVSHVLSGATWRHV